MRFCLMNRATAKSSLEDYKDRKEATSFGNGSYQCLQGR
jgi:hypothetical protein